MRVLRVLGISIVVWGCPDRLSAQPASTSPPEFEAASIKPHPPSGGPAQSSMSDAHGRLNYINVTVRACIRNAYGLKTYPPALASDPLSTDRYDIIAKAPGDATKEETMRMLQKLLADRFKLVVHRETKELPMYALAQGKGKPKLHEVADDGSAPEIGSGGGHQIRAHHVSMNQLAGALRGYIGDTVVDATGLTGRFDFTLDFTLDENPSAGGLRIFEAVQEQLGLKLEARKGPVEVIVIDHVERPTGN
jgi:uncharacterized protein (TIGR03435 family)